MRGGAGGELAIKYRDDDGDEVLIASSSSLVDAVNLAQARGATVLKLSAVVTSDAMASAKGVWHQLAADLGVAPAELNMLALGGAVAATLLVGLLSLGGSGGRRGARR